MQNRRVKARDSTRWELIDLDVPRPPDADIDAFHRVMRRGRKILYEPSAAVRHDHPASYAGLQRRMYNWGRGHIAFLLNIAATDPAYHDVAMADVRNWFSYQLKHRLRPQLLRRDSFPAGLTARELAGGLASVAGFWLGGMRAKARGSRKVRRAFDAAMSDSERDDPPDSRDAPSGLRGLLRCFEALPYHPSERLCGYRVQ